MYTVIVGSVVIKELEAIWDAAGPAGKQEAHHALTLLNERLTTAPYDQSESREDGERVMIVMPVGIRYTVHDAISRVDVLSVWYIRRREQH